MIRHLVIGLVSVSVLTACTTMQDRVGSNSAVDYSKHDERISMKLSEALKNPDFKNDYEVPPASQTGLSGKAISVVSPTLVLPLLKNTFIQEGSQSAMINIDRASDETTLDEQTWGMVKQYFEANGWSGNEQFSGLEQRFLSNWVPLEMIGSSLLLRTDEEEQVIGEGKFELVFTMKSHQRSGLLEVNLVDSRSFDNTYGEQTVRMLETSLLNGILMEKAKSLRIASERRKEEFQLGVELILGADDEGESNLVADAEYDIAWSRLIASLRELGFSVNDSDRSAGMIYAKYTGGETSFFSALFGESEALSVKKQTYHIQLGDLGNKTSIAFLDDENIPMPSTFYSEIHTALAELMGNNSLKVL